MKIGVWGRVFMMDICSLRDKVQNSTLRMLEMCCGDCTHFYRISEYQKGMKLRHIGKQDWRRLVLDVKDWRKHLTMAALRVMEHEIGWLEFRGRQKTHDMDTHRPYLHWFLCLSCQVTLTLCPPKDIRRRPLALANCWPCLPWFHTSALPSAAGASLGQTGAWLWWAMRKVIFFCLGEIQNL